MISVLKNKEATLKYAIAGFLLLFVVLVGYAFFNGKYFVAEEDETIYYNCARLFSETGSVRATECNTENVAKVWQCNWYGPMYYLFYGGIAKIAGIHNYNFLLTNIACLVLILLLILKADFSTEIKLLIICSFLTLYSMIGYVFTFYPETLEILFAVILTLKLKKIAIDTGSTRKIALYILLVMFFALFRVSTVFWVFGLLAFSQSRKDFFKKLGLSLACFLLIYLYLSYFNAPVFTGGLAHIMNDKPGLAVLVYLVRKIAWNAFVFFSRNPFYDLLQIPVILVAVYSWFISKNRFMLAACIISIIYYIVLLTLYVPYSFFLNKQSACLYPLLLVAFFYTDTSKLKYLTLGLLLIFSPISYLKAAGLIRAKKQAAIENEKAAPLISQIDQIRSKIEGGKPRTILTLYREFENDLPYSVLSCNLPASTTDKQPILYTYNFPIDRQEGSVFKNELNFQTHGKLYVDYILSKHALSIDSTTMVYSCNLFYLYKNNKRTK